MQRNRQQQGSMALATSLALILVVAVGTIGLVSSLSAIQPTAPRSAYGNGAGAQVEAAVRQPVRADTPRPTWTPTATAIPRAADLPTAASAPQFARAMPEPTRGTVVTAAASGSTSGASSRAGCDPAYPEARTCIPPGPPFDQGCAITDQRLFEVLPPDPQGLDHDGDGIGCEPIKTS